MGGVPEDPGLIPGRNDLYASLQSDMVALRDVLRMALPIIVGTASGTVMHFVNAWMVSRVGTNEIAAVSPAGMWVFVIIAFLIGLVSCTNTFVGQSFGAGRQDECARYAWQGIFISLIVGSAAICLWPIAPMLFSFVGHGIEVQEREVIYFRIRLFSINAMAANVALATFFQGINRPRIPMVTAIIANGINAVLDWILIFGKLGFEPMGIRGAATATVIAAFFNTALLVTVFLSPSFNERFASRRAFGWDSHRIGRLFDIGWPAGITFSLDVASWSVFTSFLIGRLGDIPLAASNIAGQIMHLSFMPTVGLSIAVTALVGQWIGRKDIAGAKHRTYMALKIGMAYMFAMGTLFFLFRRQLISLFRSDPEVIEIGSRILMVVAVFQAFDAMGIVTSSALKGAGDTRWVAICMVAFTWFVFLPLSYVFAFRLGLGAPGAWIGGAIYICIVAMVLLWRFHSEKWRKIDIFGAVEAVPSE